MVYSPVLKWIVKIASYIFVVLTLGPCLAFKAFAADDVPTQTSTNPGGPIAITIQTSRSSPSAGQGLGIVALITNTSDNQIYINEHYISLVLPPELRGPRNSDYWTWGSFPTEYHVADVNDPAYYYYYTVVLQPKDTYEVIWNFSPEPIQPPEAEQPSEATKLLSPQVSPAFTNAPDTPSLGPATPLSSPIPFSLPTPFSPPRQGELQSWFEDFWNFLFFSPGNYKISVILKYWICKRTNDIPCKCTNDIPYYVALSPVDPTSSKYNYNVMTQDAVIHVSAPQSVILTGAAVGGLMAFIVLPTVRRPASQLADESPAGSWGWYVQQGVSLIGAIAFAMMVTILLSRMSETQSFIKVDASDFWGAIAVGFVANYAGKAILRNILPSPSDSGTIGPNDPKPAN